MTRPLRVIAVLCAAVALFIFAALWLRPWRGKGNVMSDKIKLLLAYAVVGVLAVLGSLYAPSAELKASCAGIAVGVTLFMRSILQPPAPPGPPSPPSGLMTMAAFALGAIGLTVVIAFFAGCGFLANHPKLPASLADEIECALEHASDDPKVLIAECGPGLIPIIADVITEKRARREASSRLLKMASTADAGPEAGSQ